MLDSHIVHERLDYYYEQVSSKILCHQSLTHGLFPLDISNEDGNDRNEGHIRDNIYCAMCLWSLGLAYRNIDNDEGRTFELEQSAVKCMRGILFFYMRQSATLEAFKKDQHYSHALHCKFDVKTADTTATSSYHHLQIDAVALYILALAQMISSGLCIIFTIDEVNFIQNLVYYIERTYRIADYGMWECGSRYNDGHRELHASSIGMVKAALESINGFNLFGSEGSLDSVIYVDPDAHYRNRATLYSLLPRESNSKTTDAALLTVIGFPAFALNNDELRKETKEKVIFKLSGKFGLRRFFRDGYGTVLEDTSKEHYYKAELKQFEGVECEWPIFYLYLALDEFFNGEFNVGARIMEKVEQLIPRIGDDRYFPKYYYVPEENLGLELEKPGSSAREFNRDVRNTFLWGQSLYIMTQLLLEKLVTVLELDPLGRTYESQACSKYALVNQRYSSFKVSGSEIVVQVCLISENRTLQANLATYGIETQTPKEIEPIVICSPHDLVRVFEELGKNRKLELSGRPKRPLGALGTSKIYKILGKTVVTYPIIFDEKDFYMSLDMNLLIDNLKSTLSFIRRSWNMRGRPTVCFFLRDHNFRGTHSTEMVNFMAALKLGTVDGTKIKLGKLQTVVSTGCVEHLDFLEPEHCSKINVITNKDERNYLMSSGFESGHHPVLYCDDGDEDDGRLLLPADENNDTNTRVKIDDLKSDEIVQLLKKVTSLSTRMNLLQNLVSKHGPAFCVDNVAVKDCIEEVYTQACYVHNWSVVRQGAGLLEKTIDSLAPSITTMLVAGKMVTLGVYGHQEHMITEPLSPTAIKKLVYSMCLKYDAREVSLQQEMLIYLAKIISTRPKCFDGMLIIRIGWFIDTMKKCLENMGDEKASAISIYSLFPSEIKSLATTVLTGKGMFRNQDVSPRNEWEKRMLEGALYKVPKDFYRHVWGVLLRVENGLTMYDHVLPQQPVLTEMTAGENVFKLRVEEMLGNAKTPTHRQLVVELLMVISTILKRNPELQIQTRVSLTNLVDDAIDLFITQHTEKSKEDFFMLHRTECGAGSATYLVRAFVNNVLNNPLSLTKEDENNCSVS